MHSLNTYKFTGTIYDITVRFGLIENDYDIKNVHNIGVRICHQYLKILKKLTKIIG